MTARVADLPGSRGRLALLLVAGTAVANWMLYVRAAPPGVHVERAALVADATPPVVRTTPPAATARPRAHDAIGARPSATPFGGAAAIVGAMGAAIGRARGADPRLAEYQACERDGHSCPTLRADLIQAALFESDAAEHSLAGDYGFDEWVDSVGPHAAKEALGAVVATSEDELARVGALMFLQRSELAAGALPRSAYRDLAGRSIAEVQLIANLHRRVEAPGADAADEFVEVSLLPDTRARKAAFLALGHLATASQLNRAIQSSTRLSRSELHAAANAAASCGEACAASLEHLLAHGGRDARLAVREALWLSPEEAQPALEARLLAHDEDR